MPGAPPGPRLPAYVQTAMLVLWPEASMRLWQRRYGHVFALRPLFEEERLVMVADPSGIKDVFTGPHDLLRAGEANVILQPVLGDRSVLLLDGAEHLRRRRLLLPPFHGERMRAYEAIVLDAANRAIDGWPVGRPFALLPEMRAITLDVIVRAVFGVEGPEDAAELKARLRRVLGMSPGRLRLVVIAVTAGLLGQRASTRSLRERVEAVDELLYEIIARRRADPRLAERADICSMLLLATDDAGRGMSDREVRDELVTLLVAGHETTATALAWAFERLLRTPGVRAELERSLAQGDDSYLDAAVKETLRVRPVIPNVARVLHADREVGGFTVTSGSTVAPSIVLTHHRADLYPRPHEFRPERFLGPSPPDTYTWLPFGGGPRRCIGAAFAQFEMRTVIRTVLTRTRLEATSRRSEPVKRTGVTLVPGRGARAIQRAAPRPARDAAWVADVTLTGATA